MQLLVVLHSVKTYYHGSKPDEIIGKAHFDESSIVISPVMTHRSDNSLSDFNKTLCGTFETISIHL